MLNPFKSEAVGEGDADPTLQDTDMIQRDRRELLPDNNSMLAILPDGNAASIWRPLATGYNVPGRSAEGHGMDNDTKVKDWSPNQSGAIPPMTEQYDPDHMAWADIIPVPAVPVSIVPSPRKSITKAAVFRTLIDGTFVYTVAPFTGPDLVDSVMVSLPRDEARTRVVFRVVPNYAVAVASQVAKYVFAISHEPNFLGSQYVIRDANATAVEVTTTEPVFCTIVPILAQDATKQNTLVLQCTIEYETVLDTNPSTPFKTTKQTVK